MKYKTMNQGTAGHKPI